MAREVRLIDEKGEQVGIVPTSKAQEMASERGYDLVEVAPNANPPVCKIIDYGQFKYQLKKAAKKQQTIRVKQIRLSCSIGENDLRTKLKQAGVFFEKGHRVIFAVRLKKAELRHTSMARSLMERVAKELENVAQMEGNIKFEPRKIIAMFAPLKK